MGDPAGVVTGPRLADRGDDALVLVAPRYYLLVLISERTSTIEVEYSTHLPINALIETQNNNARGFEGEKKNERKTKQGKKFEKEA